MLDFVKVSSYLLERARRVVYVAFINVFCQIHCWLASKPVITHRFSTGCTGTDTVGAAENLGIHSS